MTKMEEFKKELEKMIMEDNKIETIDCRISEEIPVKPAAFVPLMWKEILRYAREKSVNVIFVTDDVKSDWWIDDNGQREFHPYLCQEFQREGCWCHPQGRAAEAC